MVMAIFMQCWRLGSFESNQYLKLETFPNASGVYSEVGTWLSAAGF